MELMILMTHSQLTQLNGKIAMVMGGEIMPQDKTPTVVQIQTVVVTKTATVASIQMRMGGQTQINLVSELGG